METEPDRLQETSSFDKLTVNYTAAMRNSALSNEVKFTNKPAR